MHCDSIPWQSGIIPPSCEGKMVIQVKYPKNPEFSAFQEKSVKDGYCVWNPYGYPKNRGATAPKKKTTKKKTTKKENYKKENYKKRKLPRKIK